ncbi:MAG: rhodanese-like domain-containing protein [Gammaproteobacteria bacterium]|nr:rhodanese-like domain-containing protein [Gammaproteobacteria bacterium]
MTLFKTFICFMMLCAITGTVIAADADKEFPGRDIYLGTQYIELANLNKQFDNVIIVDVRSKYEFETLRISGAKNISVNSISFIKKMRELRDNNKNKNIIVYCNGKTCMKSYKAASKCKTRGVERVIAFDAGIMDWAKAYPEKSVLLGKSPINPDNLIAKSVFKTYLLSPDKFADIVNTGNAIVLDVRDRLQRMGLSLFVGAEYQASLDDEESINRYIRKAKTEKKTMLVYDEAGKQVRWLMYRLEEQGVKDYKFLKGGTRQYFKSLREKLKH